MTKMLSVRDLHIGFGAGRTRVHAVRGVSFDVRKGRVLGVVGESGSGKSTVGRAIAGLLSPDSGTVSIDGVSVTAQQGLSRSERARQVQMVFQDPYSSLNPKMTVSEAIQEGLRNQPGFDRRAWPARRDELLDLVRLPRSAAALLPRELSGGMRQRVCIARALAVEPRLLVADEITSSLDASVQGAVLNLIDEIRERTSITMVFISHNLAVVRYISDEIVVMQRGEVVESGETETLLRSPQNEYTRSLLRAIPRLPSPRRQEGR